MCHWAKGLDVCRMRMVQWCFVVSLVVISSNVDVSDSRMLAKWYVQWLVMLPSLPGVKYGLAAVFFFCDNGGNQVMEG